MKILIALATYNRPIITELCLHNLAQCLDQDAALAIYDDCSTTYDGTFLGRYGSHVMRFPSNRGINLSRLYAFKEFLTRFTDFELLYITDNDTIHDPSFLRMLRMLYRGSPADAKLPIGLYNSVFHSRPDNILREMPNISVRKTCPGISQCYDRAMVAKIVDHIDHNPGYERLPNFDFTWPFILGVPFIQTKQSFVEHFARDRREGGIHGAYSGEGVAGLADFDRDRALNPTPYLAAIRGEVIRRILGIEDPVISGTR